MSSLEQNQLSASTVRSRHTIFGMVEMPGIQGVFLAEGFFLYGVIENQYAIGTLHLSHDGFHQAL